MRKNPRQIVRICTTLKEPMFPLSVKWIINESIVMIINSLKNIIFRINDFLRYILQIDKELPENKKGQISKNMSLSRLVEKKGFEPSTS